MTGAVVRGAVVTFAVAPAGALAGGRSATRSATGRCRRVVVTATWGPGCLRRIVERAEP